MPDRDFIFWMSEELQRLAEPLQEALQSPDDFLLFLERYGWSPPPGSFQIEDVRSAFDLADDLQDATLLFGELLSVPNGDVPLDKYLALAQTFRGVADKARKLALRPRPPGLSQELWTAFGNDLLHGLVADYLESYRPLLFALLIATGVVEETPVPAGASPGSIAFVRRRIRWSRLQQALTDPNGLVREVYGWNDPAGPLRFEHLIERLDRVLGLLRMPTAIRAPAPALRDAYYSPGHPDLPRVRELGVHLMVGENDQGQVFEYTLAVLPVPPVGSPAAAPEGLVLSPSFVLGQQPTGLLWPFSLEFGGVLQSEGGVRLELEPGRAGVATGSPASTTVAASFALIFDSPNSHLVLGSAFSHRLQLHGWRVGVAVSGPVTDPEFAFELGLNGVELVAVLSEGDSFISELFGAQTKQAKFDTGFVWSSKTGLHFRGSGALELVIPVHLTIGPIEVNHVTLNLSARDEKTALTAGVSGSGKIGPVTVAVSNVGVELLLTPVAEGEPAGVLGDLDLDFGFKPPDGLGLAIETSVVSGGGFLRYDEPRFEYSGVLALDVAGVEVSAMGLLTTRLPGNEPGYSFVAVVSAEFSPVQLGLGFTLNGVGGILGIHRSASIEALRTAMRGSGATSILFPEDAIAHAARLTFDLRSFFPPTKGRHLFGPAAKIGWGTPTLVEAELAVLIELPAPIRIVLLGAVHAALPSADSALIELNVEVVGLIDFGGKRLEIDAVLRESHVLGFPLTGEAALRLTWGDPPNFALAIGGFNKRFQPPAGFPSLERVKINIGAEDNPRIDIQGYLALTSNTAQFGARAELFATKYGLNIHGWVGFDTLFVFRPFSFTVDLSAGVELRRGSTMLAGVQLEATLTGPRPWRAYGEACLEIWLLPDLCVDFDVEWGPGGAVEAPATDVWAVLEAAVEDARNWNGSPASGALRVVALAPAPGAAAEALLDPMGPVTLRQSIVPLNRKITKFGEAKPSGVDRFDVTGLSVGPSNPPYQIVTDFFARAQFEDLSQDERLSRDSFEKMDAGLELTSAELTAGGVLGKELVCEERVLDSRNDSLPPPRPFRPSLVSQLAALELSATAQAPLRTTGPSKFSLAAGALPQVALGDERFVVASVEALTAREDIASPGRHGEIAQALAAHLATHPEDRGRLQIVPVHELVEVA